MALRPRTGQEACLGSLASALPAPPHTSQVKSEGTFILLQGTGYRLPGRTTAQYCPAPTSPEGRNQQSRGLAMGQWAAGAKGWWGQANPPLLGASRCPKPWRGMGSNVLFLALLDNSAKTVCLPRAGRA